MAIYSQIYSYPFKTSDFQEYYVGTISEYMCWLVAVAKSFKDIFGVSVVPVDAFYGFLLLSPIIPMLKVFVPINHF